MEQTQTLRDRIKIRSLEAEIEALKSTIDSLYRVIRTQAQAIDVHNKAERPIRQVEDSMTILKDKLREANERANKAQDENAKYLKKFNDLERIILGS